MHSSILSMWYLEAKKSSLVSQITTFQHFVCWYQNKYFPSEIKSVFLHMEFYLLTDYLTFFCSTWRIVKIHWDFTCPHQYGGLLKTDLQKSTKTSTNFLSRTFQSMTNIEILGKILSLNFPTSHDLLVFCDF